MTTILSIGTGALGAYRRALDTVAQNIANVNTPGYSRQNITLSARPPQFVGIGYIGRGVQASAITRSYSQFLTDQVQSAGSAASRFSTLASFAGRVDDLLADPAGGLSPALSSFYSSVQDFATDPSVATRTALFAEAGNLVSRYQALDERLADTTTETSQAVAQNVSEINELAGSLAQLNAEITRSGQNAPANDLLDQRDEVVRQIAERINVNPVLDSAGNLNLFIGNGQTLVISNEVFPLGVQQSEFDPTRSNVVYEGLNGTVPIENVLTGGSLGALLEFQSNVLDPSRRALGATAVALTDAVNAQNAAGFDALGNQGGDIFTIGSPRVIASNLNSGSATVTATIADLSEIDDTGYRFLNDGAGFRLVREDSQAVIPLTGSGTSADPFVGGGLSIVVSGTADAGDQFQIEPTLAAVDGIGVAARDGSAFAAAGLLRADAAVANNSNASIDNGTVVDPDNPNLLDAANITFLTDTTYSVDGGPAVVFDPDSPITVNGAEFRIEGTPAAGDVFNIERNTNASGDNRNALALAATQDTPVIARGTLSVGQAYSALVANVGAVTARAQSSAEAQAVVLESAENRRLELSGVDLDEEAANLIRFQQAYEAAAQVVAVGGQLFEILLNATRR